MFRRMLERIRPFLIAFMLTMLCFATAAGLLLVDYRCRIRTHPAVGTTASLTVSRQTQVLTFQWFDTKMELSFGTDPQWKRLLEAFPALIPRPLRLLSLLHPAEEPTDMVFSTHYR